MAGLLVSAVGYLLGSINSSIIISRLVVHQDIRTMGSGNAGGTNVLRNLGVVPLVLVVVLDLAKTAAAVLLGGFFFPILGADWMLGACIGGFFTVIGDIYPLFFGFKGGKAVLTSAIIILLLNPFVFLALFLEFFLVLFISRMVSFSSITVASSFPVFVLIYSAIKGEFSIPLIIFSILVAFIIVIRHKSNIERMRNGTERKIGKK